MPLECQLQYLAQFGFQVPNPEQAVETELAQDGKLPMLPPVEETETVQDTEVIENGI